MLTFQCVINKCMHLLYRLSAQVALLDGATTYLTVFVLTIKRASIFFVYAVARNHAWLCVFFEVFVAFFYSYSWMCENS